MAAELENLTLTGAAAINGTGNALANILTGNAGDNILDGGAGADTLIGGARQRHLRRRRCRRRDDGSSAAGTDTVQSSVSYTLGANVENLTLTGSAGDQRHRQHSATSSPATPPTTSSTAAPAPTR